MVAYAKAVFAADQSTVCCFCVREQTAGALLAHVIKIFLKPGAQSKNLTIGL